MVQGKDGVEFKIRVAFLYCLFPSAISQPFPTFLQDETLLRYFLEGKKEWKVANIFVSQKRKKQDSLGYAEADLNCYGKE